MVKGRTSLVMAGAGSLGLWLVSTSAFAAPAAVSPAVAVDGTGATGQARASLLIRVQDGSEEGGAAGEEEQKKKKKGRDRGDRGRGDGEGGRALQAPQEGGGGQAQQPRAVEQQEADDGRGERKKQRAKEKAEEERKLEQLRAKQVRPPLEDRSQQTQELEQRDPAEMRKSLEDAAERQKKQREKEAEQKEKRREKQERALEELRQKQGADPEKTLQKRDAVREEQRQKQRDKEEAVQEKKDKPKEDAATEERRRERFGRDDAGKDLKREGEAPKEDATREDRGRERFGRDDAGKDLKREGEAPKEDATGEDRGRERFGREEREGDQLRRGLGRDKKQERRAARRLDQLKELRKERKEGDRLVIEEPDNRVIFKDRGRTIIKHDERERFRRSARDVREQRRPDGGRLTIFIGPDGAQIVTEYDRHDRMLRRLRRHGGREYVIIDNRRYYHGVPPGPRGYYVDLPPPVIGIPREDYIVDYEGASEEDLYEALTAPPIEPLERGYALEEIQQSYGVRERMRSVDLDTINFDFGSWEVTPEYYGTLERLAEVINRIVQEDPQEVYLIEGHTDAVGNEVDNLSLSDRRAEAVAVILSENFGVPAENLVTQGYGEEFLKIPTEAPERANRRVSVRRITPLMTSEVQGQGQPLPR